MSALCACSSREMARLQDIESYIQERPDSAYAELQTIEPSVLRTKKEKALFSLLNAMAQDKNYIDIADSEIIEPALSFYSHHKQGDHYTASLFYSGRISFNKEDYSKAVIAYQCAMESTESPYWRGMLYSHMGYSYNRSFNMEEELSCAKKGLDIALARGDSMKINQARGSLATAYHNNRMHRQADSLLSILVYSDKPYYVSFPQLADSKIKQADTDYNEIVSLFEEGMAHDSGMTIDHWCEYAYALYKCGNQKRSDAIFKQLEDLGDDMHIAIWKARVAEDEKDFESALKYEKEYEQLADSLVHAQLSQSVFKAQAEHYKLASELESSKRKQSFMTASILILVILMIASIVISVYLRRQRRMADDIARLSAIADESESMLRLVQDDLSATRLGLDETESKLEDLRRSYAKTYQSQFAEIGRLFDYYRPEDSVSSTAVRKYKERTDKIIAEICHGDELQGEFEDRINRDLDNIMAKLRNDFPEFKESDFRFLSYVIVGFDATTRAIILDETPVNMRVKKARLLKKIRASQPENLELYNCFLSPQQ